MKDKRIYSEPIPQLVSLSNSYSSVNANVLYIPTPKEYKKLGDMNINDFSSLVTRTAKAMNSNKSFQESLDYTITTGSLLFNLMNKKDINTVKLGDIVGVSSVSVGRWVNGVTSITEENLNKLAKYFDVSVDYLKGIDSTPSHEIEVKQKIIIKDLINKLNDIGISTLDKEILKECGYYLIDPYLNHEYYDFELKQVYLTENQRINKKEWLTWVYTIGYSDKFPSQVALLKTSDLERMNIEYSNFNVPVEYSEEIKNIAQYVDYAKLKLLLEDRKRQLAFNFEMSLESIK